MSATRMYRLALMAACASAALTGVGRAQQADDQATPPAPAASEEIVVTATQRATSLQDVAVAVTPVTAELVKNAGVADIQDLQQVVPSLQFNVSENETSATARLRGIGTQGSNFGLESSVGVVVDGVYRVRNGVALSDLGEVAQIEVLRGPQGTLFGRNTSAGLINVKTAPPNLNEYGVNLEGEYGNFDSWRVGGDVNVPIIQDQLAVKVYGATAQRDGFLTVNPGLPNQFDSNDRNFWTIRPQLLWSPTSDIDVRIIGDYTRRDEQCCAAQVFSPQLLSGNFFQGPPSAANPNGPPPVAFPAPTTQAVAALGGYGPGGAAAGLARLQGGDLEDRIGFANRNFAQDLTEWGVSGQFDWDLGWATLTSVTAYRDWLYEQGQDADFSGLDLFIRPDDGDTFANFEVFSQEIRLAGSVGPVDWLGGFIFANEDLTRQDKLIIGNQLDDFLTVLSAGFAGLGALPENPDFLNGIGGGLDRYEQDSESYAVFTHNIWHVDDKTEVTLGLRYTHEVKELTADFQTIAAPGANLAAFAGVLGSINTALTPFANCNPNSLPPAAFGAAAIGAVVGLRAGYCLAGFRSELDAVGYDQRRTEDQVTGIFSVSRRLTDNLRGYASYSKGYKAGGFNLDRDFTFTLVGGSPSTEFQEETVDAFEVGAKTTWLDGDLLINVAGFYQTFDNFQLNTFNGLQFVVTAIPEVVSQGFEVDYIWNTPVQDLSLSGGVAFADAEYGEDGGFVAANANPVNGELSLFRLPNATLTNQPNWTVTSALTYDPLLFNETVRGLFHIDFRWVTDQNTGSQLNPAFVQPSYYLVNGRIGMSFLEERVGVEVFARNILDADYQQIAFDLPFQSGANGAFLGDPRTYGVALRLSY